ncbi:MAG: long-chain N-acyl amino acid synthase [Pirellulales bacterium]|nr:long-chain N-acyl amino acid synthase [Pirellulales bacterium]
MLGTEQGVLVGNRTTDDLVYKIASTRWERAAAFHLVYNSYLEAGLGEPNPHQMRVTPYHLLPTTETFLATLDGEAVFTLSLVADGELGLPMEAVYPDEVAGYRAHGLRVGEVSCLADRRSQFRGFFPVFLQLGRLMVQYARKRELDALLIAVHPRHVRFYRRFLDFRPLGDQRDYPTVRNNPAIALCLDFERVDRELPENYDTFFGQPLPAEELTPHPILAEDVDYFRPMIDPTFRLAPLEGRLGGMGAPAPDRGIGAA